MMSETSHQEPKPRSIKALAESPALTHIPLEYVYSIKPNEPAASEPQDLLPVIDLSFLTSGDPDQRSQAIGDLSRACRNWGFFMVINHSVPENLMNSMVNVCEEFFDLSEEEKHEFRGNDVLSPIKFGTSYNVNLANVFFWRDYLKILVHPEFHSPNKPTNFCEISREYSKQVRRVARELLRGISVSLGLAENYIDKAMNLCSGYQTTVVNLYPPCPQPELAMGLPPHSDHGLLTILIQNGITGLELQQDGKWVSAGALPNAFLVNTADQLEILSNGRYKSVLHRAVVNNKARRISVGLSNGPSLETIVEPAPELVESAQLPAYRAMKYKDYIELQQSNPLVGKSCLERIRLQVA